MVTVQKISSELGDLEIIRTLFKEYLNELNEDLCFQSFDDELKDPLKKYRSPYGALFLAYVNENAAGCIALQPLKEEGICEMKRLYVKPQYRKHKVGEKLVEIILDEAMNLGYKKMVLDTLERLQPAIKLYSKHGFINTSAYYKNPLLNAVYMERHLQ